jgi:cytochrome P450 family 6
LKTMYDTINVIADGLMDTIDRESGGIESLNIKEIMARFTTDVIGDTAFGLNCHSVNNKSALFFEMSVKSMESFHFGKRLVLMQYKNIARMLRMKLTPTYVSDFYSNVVKSTIDHRTKNSAENRNDLMNLLMNMMKNDGLTLDQVTAQSFFYFVSGYETSSTTLVFCLYELATHSALQEKARQSVEEVLHKFGDELTYDSIGELEYLDRVIKETLRKWPPSASIQRVALKDYKIPNSKLVIEKDCAVMIPVYGIHHDPEIYPNPTVFDPDRFLPEVEKLRHPFAYLPFGEGPRICPAIKFAMLEVKICLAKLLMKYHLSLDTNKTHTPLRICPTNFMMNPVGGVYVNFDKLHHDHHD